MLEYRVDDKALDAQRFIELAQQVWPGDYDPEKTRRALERTINITAWDGAELVGCLRILTDGCFLGTIPEVLVLPRYQRQGIGAAPAGKADHAHSALFRGPAPGGAVL